MSKPATLLVAVFTLVAIVCAGLLVSQPGSGGRSIGSPRSAGTVGMTGAHDTAASASRVHVIPSRSVPIPAGWRSVASSPMREGVGFIVDRATLGWLPREFALEEGDAILRINGEAIISTDQLVEAVQGSSEGSAVEFQIRLAGSTETVSYSVTR